MSEIEFEKEMLDELDEILNVEKIKENNDQNQELKLQDQQNLELHEILKQQISEYENNQQKIESNIKTLHNIYNEVYPIINKKIKNKLFYCYAVLGFNDFENMNPEYFSKIKLQISKIILNASQLNIEQKYQKLSEENKLNTQKIAQETINIINQEKIIYESIEQNVNQKVPNIKQICGVILTAKILIESKGLKNLSLMPSCNIQIMGESKQKSLQLKLEGKISHIGLFDQHPLFNKTEKQFQKKLVKFLSNGVAKMSRIDVCEMSQDGQKGRNLWKEIEQKLINIQKPKKFHQRAPLKIPGTEKKIRRGGKRQRKNNEKYEITDIRRQKNILKFGEMTEDNILQDMGLLGQQDSRHLKIKKQKKEQKISKKQRKNLEHQTRNQKQGLSTNLVLENPEGILLLGNKIQKEQLIKNQIRIINQINKQLKEPLYNLYSLSLQLMISKDTLKNRESVYLKPYEEESKYFMVSLNQALNFEIQQFNKCFFSNNIENFGRIFKVENFTTFSLNIFNGQNSYKFFQ